MPKNFRNCPGCRTNSLMVEFTVIQRETCTNCNYLTQRRITPVVQGGLGMIRYLTDHMMKHNGHLSGLETALQQQLAKVQRREAKRCNRNNGGPPPREEDWR